MQHTELLEIKKELIALKDITKHGRVKDLIQSEIYKVTHELADLAKKQTKNDTPNAPTKISVDIKEHAFDESDKFVKIFIPFDTSKIKETDVELNMTETSFNLVIHTTDKKHHFNVTSLFKSIDCEKSYKKVKSDMVSVYLKKVKEADTWGCLTTTEKRLQDSKSKMFDETEEENSDPGAALMNIMKKMYETGDPEMKRTIAKAWTEGQNQQKQFAM